MYRYVAYLYAHNAWTNSCHSLYKQGAYPGRVRRRASLTYAPCSYCRQRARPKARHVGYVGSSKVVRTILSPIRTMLNWCRDAWAKHKDLDPYEAKWLYVEALLKVRIMRNCIQVVRG